MYSHRFCIHTVCDYQRQQWFQAHHYCHLYHMDLLQNLHVYICIIYYIDIAYKCTCEKEVNSQDGESIEGGFRMPLSSL